MLSGLLGFQPQIGYNEDVNNSRLLRPKREIERTSFQSELSTTPSLTLVELAECSPSSALCKTSGGGRFQKGHLELDGSKEQVTFKVEDYLYGTNTSYFS